MKKNFLVPIILMGLISISLISAFDGYSSVSDYLNNEWVQFTLIFLLFFVVIYFAVGKAVDNNAIAGIIGVALGLLITIAVLKKGALQIYFGNAVGDWMMTIGFLIVMLFLFMVLMYYTTFLWAIAIEIMVIFGFFVIIGAEKFVPENMMSEQMQMFIWFMNDLGNWGYVFLGIAFIVFLWKKKAAPFKAIKKGYNVYTGVRDWRRARRSAKLTKYRLRKYR